MFDETIVALASAGGGAARGIVRLSGATVRKCLDGCFEPRDRQTWAKAARSEVFAGCLRLAGSGARLECDVYLWPRNRSYTRQPTAEVHTLGSPPLLDAVVATLAHCGARPARPGEFTLRAFLAGRLDLTQAEAVLGVIDAEGTRQLADALKQLAGGLAGPLDQLRSRLLDLLAHLEAGLDFIEEDIQFIEPELLSAEVAQAAAEVAELLARMGTRTHSADTARVVLLGQPNVGKSTLFNALASRGAALVSPLAGTTRDYLVAPLELAGLRYELVDTAGYQDAHDDELSAAAGEAAARQAREADVQIFCLDGTRDLTAWENAQLAAGASGPRLVIWTKADAMPGELKPCIAGFTEPTWVSALTGAGLEQLRARLHAALVELQSPDCRVVAGTAARSRASLSAAAEALAQAQQLAATSAGQELIAAELRIALDALGEVAGAIYTDDILDRIFSRFCIGK